ncbi:toprim domain-containing protein [Arcobacter caeni]|uniref:Zinc finger CHC2-type domain-containing protein n=1 Tax=Arcobacter caeni TaxID=1912877 RepID=A0A363D293_9BACT|nr:toprim domain-containing protein [Arcobacter caeni]PUE65475.1 hypothetical protein B0174_03910 [Arcobacter caeni]
MKKDTEKLNNIPIAKVANLLDIDISSKKVVKCFKGHGEKTPSLSFQLNKNFFNCFSCQISGGPINLVKEFYNCSFIEACSWLENRFFNSTNTISNNFESPKYQSKILEEDFFEADSEVYEWLIQNTTLSQETIAYFKSRGITEKTLNDFKIKDIQNPYFILNEAKNRWGLDRVIKCGLWKYKNYKYMPVWWHHVILFPFFDIQDRITYIQGRFLNHEYRWMNLSGVKSTIFNARIFNNLKFSDNVVITEGLTDTLSLYQRGINAIGIMGASNFKIEYVDILKNYEILVAPDNDPAGEMFYKKIEKLFEVHKSIRKVVIPSQFNDVNDALKGKSSE